MAKSIVIVEDEKNIRENYVDLFTRQGYEVKGYGDRQSAEAAFKRKLPDLAILDIGLNDEPDGGFDLCRQLRSQSSLVPIIFLTARDSDIDEISGLRLGADDYLTKNVGLPQLLARVSALFRRTDAMQAKAPVSEQVLEVGDLNLNIDRLEARWKGEDLNLTVTEMWILHELVLRPGHVKGHAKLMEAADTYVEKNTINSHIKRLRKKFVVIDKDFEGIESVYGAGYRWKQ